MWRWLIFFILLTRLHYGIAQTHADKEANWNAHGNQLMKHGNYHGALKIFQRLDTLYPNSPAYCYALGQCIFRAGDKPSSLPFFLKAKQLGFEGNTLNFDLAKAYYFNNEIEDALFYLMKYEKSLVVSVDRNEIEYVLVDQLRKQIKSSEAILGKKLSVTLTNMGPKVNSPQADYVPVPFGDGNQLVFTSRRHKSTGGKLALDGVHYEDIYTTKKDSSGEWIEADHFKGFNSYKHDANVAMNKDGSVLLIYKAKHNGDLFSSVKKQDGTWSTLRPLDGINSLYWEGSACLSFDETMLFFSSDRPGGYGGSDLYSATVLPDGTWSDIKNLGEEINTSLDEDAPFLYTDSKTLFFSSKGHNSLGGYDIFSAHFTADGTWSTVKNMGFPINTFDDDIYFHLTADGSVGYFTSFHHSNFKEKSIGEKDLFQISRPHASPAWFILKGKIIDNESGNPITAVVTVKEITQNKQMQVADISTGLFKFELQFEKRYRLSVEVAGKIYDSGELFFPYQADLFEYFMPIKLDSVPTFDLKLADLLQVTRENKDSKPLVLKKEQRAIILVRKAAFDEPDLKKLMESDKIPFSFRAKIAQQRKDTSFLDLPSEGNLKSDLLSSLLDSAFKKTPAKMELPNNAKRQIIDASEAKQNHEYNLMKKELLAQKEEQSYDELSDQEQQLIDRLVRQVTSPDTSYQVNTFDLLYYENLSSEEKNKIKAEVIARSQGANAITGDMQKQRFLMLQELVESNKIKAITKSKLAFYDKEAWEIFYSIETGGFEKYDHLQFQATLVKRNNGAAVPAEKLIVIEDDGLLFHELVTNEKGEFILTDLIVGKRYHILVNDYTIALTGLSRYQLRGRSLQPKEEDYMMFYNQLTSEEKRRVDRISASLFLKQAYKKDAVLAQEDPLSLERFSDSEKEFVNTLQKFMKSDTASDSNFVIDQRQSERYEKMDYLTREKYDRLLSRNALMNEYGNFELPVNDSLFYQRLTDQQKKHIAEISRQRTNRNHIIGAWLTAQTGSQYWYEMQQINTTKQKNGKVRIDGRITSTTQRIDNAEVSVGLMDESGKIISVETDSTGHFTFYSVDTNRDFKLLMSKPAVGNVNEYELNDLTIKQDEIGLYDNLSATERRRIDRIIARNLSEQDYAQSPSLASRDAEVYRKLSATEKAFIKRLQQYLFADTVTEMNSQLESSDHHIYYATLSAQERAYINRYVIQSFRDTLSMQRVELKMQDSIVYSHLSAVQKLQVDQLQARRRKAVDIFGENPTLMAMKRRILLDSLSPGNTNGSHYDVRGRLMDKNLRQGVGNTNVYLSDKDGNVITMVTSDSEGYFIMTDQATDDEIFAMVETNSSHLFSPIDFQVENFRIEIAKQSHSSQLAETNKTHDEVEIYFDYNSSILKATESKRLTKWLETRSGNEYSVMLGSHTDSMGNEKYNQELSERRAQTVKMFLNLKGVKLIDVRAYGEKRIKYPQDKLNRRVEVVVTY